MEQPDIELIAFKRTPVFTCETAPDRLFQLHPSDNSVYGKLMVKQGELTLYFASGESFELSPEQPGWIEPAKVFKISCRPQARFYMEFYRETGLES